MNPFNVPPIPPNTPWGPAQRETLVELSTREGSVLSLSTAGHGGLKLDERRWNELPADVRETFYHRGFAEEDCEMAIALALLDDIDWAREFSRPPLAAAIDIAKRFPRYAVALPYLERQAEQDAAQKES